VDAGELVYAYHEATGEVGLYPVTDEIAHLDKEIVTLVIEGERIYTTPEHPFSVNGQWIDASKLSIGDLVRRLDGSTGDVEAITTEERPQVMYNLTVAVAHTFFVGEQQWLVQNGQVACVALTKTVLPPLTTAGQCHASYLAPAHRQLCYRQQRQPDQSLGPYAHLES
jgi:hypothetical protein